MTVKELIDELKKYNQNAEIQIWKDNRDNFTYDFSINASPSENKEISHESGTITYQYKVILKVKENNFRFNLRQP